MPATPLPIRGQPSSETERLLSSAAPFKQLPPPERQRLASVSMEKRYAKGETVFEAGAPAEAVWLVKTGRVHLMKFLPSGKASTTCVMGAGDPFCCLPALDRQPYPVDAIAAEDSVIVRIPINAFHEAMGRSPAFAQETMCFFCSRLRGVEERGCMMFESVEARLAQVLLALSKKFGSTIPLTRQELAEMAGTTHETAIRTFSRLKKQGVISSVRGKTTILKPERLQALLEQ